MKLLQLTSYAKVLSYTVFGVALLHGANSYAAVSQSPLSLTVGVPPNMALTLDDSGSMRWAFAPDNINGVHATRRAKSSDFNPLYFNPNISYSAPIVFSTAGTEQQLSTSYSAALLNGYKSTYGSIDLRSNYKFTWSYDLLSTQATAYGYSNTSNRLGENPSADFSASATRTTNGTTTVTKGNISFAITRSGNNSCTATATLAGVTVTATCTGSNNNFTATLAQRGVPAYYYTYDATLATNCTTANENCYRLNFVSSDQQQNFANWYSFYRNRALATISAAALAFYDLSSSVRLTWQGLGNCTSFTGNDTSNCYNNSLKEYSATHKGQLYAWLQNINFNQSTPLPAALKRAGEFYTTAAPWQKNPNGTGNTTQNTYACRASYHILMTDGQWNATTTMPSNFRHDATTFTLPDGRTYSERKPFYDSQAQTLADLAMHYWATDLQPSLDNKVPAYIPFKSGDTTTDYWNARNDPATWQHMTNFVMGLGLTESLNNTNVPWAGSTFTGTGYNNLVDGTATWPAASSGSANNVYDLWHAAINSRGEFFSVDSPEAMVQAFDDILSRIADRKSTAARPAINSGQVSTDENDNGTLKTVSYQTSYASDDNWSGDVKRFEKSWNAETSTLETKEVWSAKANVPGTRNIKIAGTGNTGLADFDANNAALTSYSGTTLLTYLNRDPENANAVDTKGAERLSYLRGNRAGEGTTYRQRSGVLGDFYSSTPAVVLNTPRYLEQFSNNLEGNTRYTDFKNSIASRSPRIYVGGNDGMLHGFNALTGVEEFAFIPSAVFPKLNKLTGTNYSHEFYVEGSPVVADVYTGTEWRTILVGTLKAGGKSIFALDITTPGQEKLLWQFDENSITDTNAVKMGYSFSQPTIARLHTGKWAVVFGNGYESANNTNGKAALFIVDAMEGTLLRSLEVQGTNGVANGLSTPKLGDFNGDGTADYAYAGDLQGNMWRFDLLRATQDATAPFKVTNDVPASAFKVGFGGNPLFRASADTAGTQRQAITSAPSLVTHPSGTGYLIVFGTGRFFDTADKEGDKSMAQSVYGIWDKQTLGETASNPNISRSSLQAQSITTTTTVSADGGTAQGRVISDNTVRWQESTDSSGATLSAQNGWYLNLVQTDGEMVVENMSQLGRTIFFQSLVPNDDPCGDGASNWTYALNPYSGGRTSQKAFDYTPTTDVGTSIVSAVRQDGEGGGTVSQNPDSSYQYCTGQSCINIYPDPSSIGRQSWRRTEEQE
ncbi:pilus assembly protein PilY [Pseudomonas daroniae]|uniref:Pilus assembly protein PilY n=2 Tax=Pseudomonadales TaxID=72274 RepID=A0A4Q9QP31_9GAMM|nr:pilus assembly protein PilY [Pseudomonas daroniae]TBU83625.1 pilus assembly protein PilY [Pseudomonas sp. FRB 228]TBU86752.1 pilus assembly protein PilY [Pseudomonas daroniae]